MGILIGIDVAHNRGQEDAAEDKLYHRPHGLAEFAIHTLSLGSSEDTKKMNEENEAYEAGYEHAKSQK